MANERDFGFTPDSSNTSSMSFRPDSGSTDSSVGDNSDSSIRGTSGSGMGGNLEHSGSSMGDNSVDQARERVAEGLGRASEKLNESVSSLEQRGGVAGRAANVARGA